MQVISTTRQNHLFPVNRSYTQSTRARGDFVDNLNRQLFEIKDDLLYGLITYGDGMGRERAPLLPGFTWSKNASFGIFVFLVSRALDLYRLPFSPDRIYTSYLSGRAERGIEEMLAVLKPERVDTLTDEIRALYTHTQAMLAQAGLTEVAVTRRVYDSDAHPNRMYATQIVRRKEEAIKAGVPTIKFEMDTLNSFGDDGGYSHFPLTLEFRVPARDVLYCANFIRSREQDSVWIGHRHAVEPGEWVIINRATDGVVELPVTQVHPNYDLFQDRHRSRVARSSRSDPDDASPIVLRSLSHLRYDSGYGGFGFEPKWTQRVRSALIGMVQGARRGYRQGFLD